MATQQNILKLLSSLGGGASESYSQGNFQKVGGQPLLPKPTMSMPHAMSPYAPGNQNGGPMAHLGGIVSQGNDASVPSPNSTAGVQKPEMRESDNHPANQLAQYLTTTGGRSASAKLKKTGTDPGMFLRGEMASRVLQ